MVADFNNYRSPLSWRYGSESMRQIWSEKNKRLLWREVWVALAEVQSEFGLVTRGQVRDLIAFQNEVDISRALEIEKQIRHDLMAELRVFADQAKLGGKVLHMGATSADIQDNADALRIRAAAGLILERLSKLLLMIADRVEEWADFVIIAYTHLQPAEPSTLGYRFAVYAQDLLNDYQALSELRKNFKGKGFKGAVGTGASYADLIELENLQTFEERLSARLDLPFFPVTTQVYPRKQEYQILSAMAGLGASLHKLAFDLRIAQSPGIGELSEHFGERQVGSSAMPFKRNPVSAEKINSLARLLAQMSRTAWDNAANSLLERTLDDSANRRFLLPESFLVLDELLLTSVNLVRNLHLNALRCEQNISIYGPFAAVERVLMALSKSGADRQEMHERLRQHSMKAWQDICRNESNSLQTRLREDPAIGEYISLEDLDELINVGNYVGDAPQRARSLAGEIRRLLS
ncbi:MAG: adenylosuccinate lyase [Anaerolineales bacterium]|jgi:adenylosuccinate lyase